MGGDDHSLCAGRGRRWGARNRGATNPHDKKKCYAEKPDRFLSFHGDLPPRANWQHIKWAMPMSTATDSRQWAKCDTWRRKITIWDFTWSWTKPGAVIYTLRVKSSLRRRQTRKGRTPTVIGQTISHYKISDKLGEGGMGVVYKAEDMKLKRIVALKFLSKQTLGTEEDRVRFIREAQTAAALDHASICTTYEISEDRGETFIAMAYLEGKTLEQKIKSGPIDPKESVDIIVRVAEGLGEAHAKGIVHRDIKSSNIMIGNKGQVKIMDFGLAKLIGATKLTKTATVMGTVAYMSPEQALGEPVDHRTDIWSLGVVLHEMLTGKLPFMAENNAAMLHKIIYDEPDNVTGINPYVPPGLSVVVAKALAKDREERYQSAAEFIGDIRSFETLQSAPLGVSPRRISHGDPQAYKRAERRVRAKMKFYKHLSFYIVINSLLLLINLMTSIKTLWFLWPLMALTIPLAIHALSVFVLPDYGLMKDRLMETELRKETSRRR